MEVQEVQLQCGGALFRFMAAKVRLLMIEAGITPGYLDKESESVYRQVECIYRVLRNEYKSGCAGLAQQAQTAVYYCALMLEAGLHPLLIYDDRDVVAVGVWVHEDYDTGQSRIDGSEFAREAYDRGGEVIPVDCSMAEGSASFSSAVAAGCRIMEACVFARDILRDEVGFRREASSVIVFGDDEKRNFRMMGWEQDPAHPCPYLTEILRLYVQMSREYPEAEGLRRPEVRSSRLAAAFFQDCSQEEKLRLLPAAGGYQEQMAAELILQSLRCGKDLLVLAPADVLPGIRKRIGNGIGRFLLFPEESGEHPGDGLYVQISGMLEEQPRQLGAQNRIRFRRLQEAEAQLAYYENVLRETAPCGYSLNELEEMWQKLKSVKTELTLWQEADARVFSREALEAVREYSMLWEQCRQKGESGEVLLDFSQKTEREMQLLEDALGACLEPADLYYQEIVQFGAAMNWEREKIDREFIETVHELSVILSDCGDIQQGWCAVSNSIPEPTKQEQESLERYLRTEQVWELEELFSVSCLRKLDTERLQELFELCQAVKTELDKRIFFWSRDCKVNLNRIGEILEAASGQEYRLNRLRRARLIWLCSRLMLYRETAQDQEDPVYAVMRQLFGKGVSENASLFAVQRGVAERYLRLAEKEILPKKTDALLRSCVGASVGAEPMSEQILSLYGRASDLIKNYYEPYHASHREVFRLLGLDYHMVSARNPGKTLMDFILDWISVLVKDRVYDRLQDARIVLLGNSLGEVMERYERSIGDPQAFYLGFSKEWCRRNRERCLTESSFDPEDYAMNRKAMAAIRSQIESEDTVALENRLLENLQHCFHGRREELESLREANSVQEIFAGFGELLQKAFPAVLASPEAAWELLESSEIRFERVLICGGDRVKLFQALFPVSRTDDVLILGESEGVVDSKPESVWMRAARMGASVIQMEDAKRYWRGSEEIERRVSGKDSGD